MDEHIEADADPEAGRAVRAAMADYRAPHCVSIYLPVEHAPWDDEVNFSRVRDALRRAARMLERRHPAPGVTAAILSSAWTLHDAVPLWSEPGEGLALFLATDRLLAFRMPRRPCPLVLVDDRFHLEPFEEALDETDDYC